MCHFQMFPAPHVPVEHINDVDSRLIMETRLQVARRHLPALIQQSLEVLHILSKSSLQGL